MNQEYKYTNDGKKVLIVGKLNAQETIVQEVFVSNEVEVPSGENFVVKSLHDSPAVSWKEKNLKELEQRYDGEKKRLDKLIQDTQRRYDEIQKKSSLRAGFLLQFAESEHPEFVDRLTKFLSGEITHYAKIGYSPCIHTVEENACFDVENNYGGIRVDGIKLISLFGLDDGSLEYRINQYRDSSGSWTKVIPCTSREEAIQHLQDHLDEKIEEWREDKTKNSPSVDQWEKIEGIFIPLDLKNHSISNEAHNLKGRIKTAKNNLAEQKVLLKELEAKLL